MYNKLHQGSFGDYFVLTDGYLLAQVFKSENIKRFVKTGFKNLLNYQKLYQNVVPQPNCQEIINIYYVSSNLQRQEPRALSTHPKNVRYCYIENINGLTH